MRVPFDSRDPAGMLTDILDWIEERIDLAHIAEVEKRFLRAYYWQPVDHPPVTISTHLPAQFAGYPYSEGFRDSVKMLINELLGPDALWGTGSPSIINSVILRDDYPLQIRANYGIGIVASLFGAESVQLENHMPWVKPIGPDRTRQAIAAGSPALNSSLYRQAIETMDLFREKLAPYPKCRQAIRITQPDQQGPFDILSQIWGGEGIFLSFYDDPTFLRQALDTIGETYIQTCRAFTAHSTQAGPADLIYLHFSMQRGGCILKDDSSVMLSPKIYREFIQPANSKVLQALGGGCIHYCGCGDQWREEFVNTPGLLGMDLGQPHMVDLTSWKPLLQEKRIAVTNAPMTLTQFEVLRPFELFPTGSTFTITTPSLEEGRRLLGHLAS